MNASRPFCLPVLLLFLLGKVISRSDVMLSLSSNFRATDVSQDSNSKGVTNGTEKDDDYVELGVISLQNLNHILKNVKQIQRFLNLLLRLQKISKNSERLRKQPSFAKRLYRFIHVYTVKKYKYLFRLINVLPRLKLATSKKYLFRPVLVYPKPETTDKQSDIIANDKIENRNFRGRQEKWTFENQPNPTAVTTELETTKSVESDVENVETSSDSNKNMIVPKNMTIPTSFVMEHTPSGSTSNLPTNEQKNAESLSENMDKILDLESSNGDEEFMNDFIADLDRTEMAETFKKLVNSMSKNNMGFPKVHNH